MQTYISITENACTVIETQTEDMGDEKPSVAIQCNLLDAPPLELFPQATASLDDSITTEPEEADLDTSYCPNQEDHITE